MSLDSELTRRTFDITVGIPAYSRCAELDELLASIYGQTVLPSEITICEDDSPERDGIRLVAERWRDRFSAEGCAVNYSENGHNLGYDGNLRQVIAISHSTWVMLIGNDDILLEECIENAARFICDHDLVKVISRSFRRFGTDIEQPIGISRISSADQVFVHGNSSAGMIFRCSGFIGGLIVKREWAQGISTTRYDGTLFYQVYLAAVAFCEGGIGYIARPIVGARQGNPPLFGSAACESDVHSPGTYTPKGRARMWGSVLQIARDVGKEHDIELVSGVKKDLEVRSSFIVFETLVGSDKRRLSEMRHELAKLDLFAHPIPRAFYLINWLFGSRAKVFYFVVRSVLQ